MNAVDCGTARFWFEDDPVQWWPVDEFGADTAKSVPLEQPMMRFVAVPREPHPLADVFADTAWAACLNDAVGVAADDDRAIAVGLCSFFRALQRARAAR